MRIIFFVNLIFSQLLLIKFKNNYVNLNNTLTLSQNKNTFKYSKKKLQYRKSFLCNSGKNIVKCENNKPDKWKIKKKNGKYKIIKKKTKVTKKKCWEVNNKTIVTNDCENKNSQLFDIIYLDDDDDSSSSESNENDSNEFKSNNKKDKKKNIENLDISGDEINLNDYKTQGNNINSDCINKNNTNCCENFYNQLYIYTDCKNSMLLCNTAINYKNKMLKCL